ncbi:hypothetical protein ZWY2020_044316 [Hordeum vulgare]|nr:hypothetical protein ZWY2020_044316 [Hordeum vulgare]
MQRPDESAHQWSRRVAEIIHSSDGITAAKAVLILEHNCHYEPLVQKLGRLKRKVQDMGELMDTLTRYAKADDTKDPGEDGKGNSPKKGDSTNKHTRLQGRNRHNQGTNGKRRPHEEPSDLVANTNANDGKKKNRGFWERPRNSKSCSRALARAGRWRGHSGRTARDARISMRQSRRARAKIRTVAKTNSRPTKGTTLRGFPTRGSGARQRRCSAPPAVQLPRVFSSPTGGSADQDDHGASAILDS